MGSQKSKILLDKYWEGNSTVQEEVLLKKEFEEILPKDQAKYKPLFDYQEGLVSKEQGFDLSFLEEKQQSGFSNFRQRFALPKKWRLPSSIAAALIVAFLSVNYQWKEDARIAAQEMEVQKAYTETLAALQFISEKLNKGNQSIYELSNFDKTKKQLINENL